MIPGIDPSGGGWFTFAFCLANVGVADCEVLPTLAPRSEQQLCSLVTLILWHLRATDLPPYKQNRLPTLVREPHVRDNTIGLQAVRDLAAGTTVCR